MANPTTIRLKQKEAKTVRFTLRNASGAAIDVSGATLAFMVKSNKSDVDGSAKITKTTVDFALVQAASGVIDLPLLATDLDLPAADYVGELKVTLGAQNIDKSPDIRIVIEQAVIAA